MRIGRNQTLQQEPVSNPQTRTISQMNQGDIFRGEILDIQQSQIKLRLQDGTIMNARTLSLLEAKIGQALQFRVQSSGEGQVLLEILSEQRTDPKSDMAFQALSAANMPPSEENIKTVQQLLEHQLPVDKHTLQEVSKQLRSGQEATLEKLIYLLERDVPIESKRISQLDGYLRHDTRMQNQLMQLGEQMDKIEDPAVRRMLIEILSEQEEVSAAERNILQQHTEADQQNTEFPSLGQEIHLKLEKKGLESADAGKLIWNKIEEKDPGRKAVARPKGEERIDGLIKKLFIDMKQADQIEDLQQYYKELYVKTSKIRELISQSENPGKMKELDEAVRMLQDHMEFQSHFTKYHQYIQIPFRMEQNIAQGDLYIFHQKKNKKRGGNQASALLALDFAYLGYVEAFVQKNYKSVYCQFRIEDTRIEKLIQSKIHLLHNTLRQKGYTLEQISYKQVEEPFHLLKQISEIQEEAEEPKRFSFDMRV